MSEAETPFVAALAAANLHPLWDRYQRITPIRPQAKDAPFIWRWRDIEPFLHQAVEEVAINDIERRALIMAHPTFGNDTTTTSTLLAASRKTMRTETPGRGGPTVPAIRSPASGLAVFIPVSVMP